jgi:hypothetical protein
MMPHEDSRVEIGKVKGEVVGVQGKELTRNISSANVYVKIVVEEEKKKKTYSAYEEKDLKRLMEEHPSIYRTLLEHGVFKAHPASDYGEFTLELPIGSWGYIIAAHVEKKDYAADYAVIDAKKFKESEDNTLEDILVFVEDKQWSVPKGVKKGDPETDPDKVPSGVVDEEEHEKRRKFIEEHKDEED